jgi:2-C-methyl-D-erythritol 4-phosphate cytidylyltransferase
MMVSLGCNVRVHTTPKLERMPRVFSSLEKAVHPIPGNHMLSKYHGVSHRGPVYRVRQHRANSRLTVKSSATDSNVPEGSVSIVLLAGGVGKRMGASIPKQYLELKGKPIATYSLETFCGMPCVGEVVVVCEPEWRYIFEECHERLGKPKPLKFALPGAERQDSVCNGLVEISSSADLVAIHDSARPLVTVDDTIACIVDAQEVGAAVLGVPVKPTIKEADDSGMVVKTLVRSVLWEVQTPQVIEPKMLMEGFDLVKKNNLEVTDDVSIIEAMGNPVRITKGCYTNIKVTTPEDLVNAEAFLDQKAM